MSTHDWSDEVLMAYADGALHAPDAARVREATAADPEIAARIDMFRASGRLLREAFGPVLRQPVPQRLCDAVQALGSEAVVRPERGVRAGRRRRAAMVVLAIAATVLGVMITLPGLERRGRDTPASLLAATGPLPASLNDTLDRLPSGEVGHLTLAAREVEVLPLASYDEAGVVCREFDLKVPAASGESLRGVACRDANRWVLRSTPESMPKPALGDGYETAAGGGELAPRLGLHRPLSGEEERRLMARGWR
ncbi:anti-sigma factor family protein [Nevskia soli]|uniref:anti-sigma factor family protein n=1 Tax=Nevskia soli TaxID=418856 RepID=UPI0012F86619|nr:hypothetical protein [Nevskia soli]